MSKKINSKTITNIIKANTRENKTLILKTNDAVFIFELKMDKGRDAEEIAQTALKQIDQKGYAAPFLASGKPVHKVAFVFSSSGEGLVSWKNK